MQLLYIDPGTGSLLFSLFIGLATVSYFLFRTLIIRIKNIFLGNKSSKFQNKSIVIYNEGSHYWPVFSPILNELENRQIDILYLTSSASDPVFNKNYNYIKSEYIGSGNKAYAALNFLEANVCLMTTPSLDVFQLKRSKFCKHYSHILHDTGDATCYRLFGIDRFDSILLSGEYQIKDLKELENTRNLPEKKYFVVGSTYLDYYKIKLNELPKESNHIFTVLISPSWGPGALLSSFGEKLLDSFIKSEWNIIIRPHPQSKISESDLLKKLEEKYSSFIWDYQDENIYSLSKADIMISDFSGIIFDFVFLFDKPVLYNNSYFNKDMYDAGDIQHEPWKFKALTQFATEITESDLPNINNIILKSVSDKSLSIERQKAKNIAWQNIGNSAKNVVDSLLSIQEGIVNIA